MTPKEYGTILARLDLLPKMNPRLFGQIASILIDFVEYGDKAAIERVLSKIENCEVYQN